MEKYLSGSQAIGNRAIDKSVSKYFFMASATEMYVICHTMDSYPCGKNQA
jgi:hypothetical protein